MNNPNTQNQTASASQNPLKLPAPIDDHASALVRIVALADALKGACDILDRNEIEIPKWILQEAAQ